MQWSFHDLQELVSRWGGCFTRRAFWGSDRSVELTSAAVPRGRFGCNDETPREPAVVPAVYRPPPGWAQNVQIRWVASGGGVNKVSSLGWRGWPGSCSSRCGSLLVVYYQGSKICNRGARIKDPTECKGGSAMIERQGGQLPVGPGTSIFLATACQQFRWERVGGVMINFQHLG